MSSDNKSSDAILAKLEYAMFVALICCGFVLLPIIFIIALIRIIF